MGKSFSIASLGGGHGLFQTLKAARKSGADQITAIVTVADDGGSSGRIRRELGIIPPGDLRMALAALADEDPISQLWADLLQHRFRGNGALAGHAVGNLMIAGLTDIVGSEQEALAKVGELTRSAGTVLPMVLEPLEIEADVAGLADDPRVIMPVRGQVAVASTPGTVRRVRLIPDKPVANPAAVDAICSADVVTLGPGSWFSSVIPHLLVPGIVEAFNDSGAVRVAFINLTAEAGETAGFSTERHIHVLKQHARALQLDVVLVDASFLPRAAERKHLESAAAALGADVVYDNVRATDEAGRDLNIHDPDKLSAAILQIAQSR